ncbi:helix-turn-helix domain-containing protein [Halalkalibacter oceani]|uniref:Helix-turn-helix transcriptional regulator n=1 Tax=Halalkalibacter oceani TaxID=1653776 RepID=A0A9X2IQ27_9BACI|nr:helix-turn-helix transcriptional regulator [Halalkalibacter oceani]MCM3716659.1 helix-turn-helix transcriptional regulator [Halalkalibacter oceani]
MEASIYGKRIRAFRKLKGYTQEAFARELGISVSVLGEVERGQRQPDEELLTQIVTVLQISRSELTSK